MTDSTPPTVRSVFDSSLRATVIGLLLIVTIIGFEAMSVATAMPTVVRALDGMNLYAWPFSAFMVANLLGMVLAGEISDRWGPSRPMAGGLVLFAIGLVIAGTAQTMTQLIIGRGVQGLGGGVIIVVMYVVIGIGFPTELHPRVFGITAVGWVMPSLLGPVVAGSLAEHGHWRLVFVGLLPLVVVGGLLITPALRRLPAQAPPQHAVSAAPSVYRGGLAARWPYALLAGAGVVLLQYAGEHRDLIAIPLVVAGVVAIVLAVRVLLPIGAAVGRRGLPTVIAMRGLAAGAFFAVEAFVPLTLSEVHGYSAIEAGVPLILGAFGWTGASWLQGRFQQLSRALLVSIGMVGVATASGLMAVVAWVPGSAWVSFVAWACGGLGMGLVMPSVGVLLLEFSTDADRGRNSAGLQISDALLSSLTIGLGGVVVAAAESGSFGLPTAVGVIDLAMVAVAFVGAAGASRLRRPKVSSGLRQSQVGVGQIG